VVVGLLTLSVVVQALAANPGGFPGGEFMEQAVYTLANPVIAAFGLVAVVGGTLRVGNRRGLALWTASLCAALIAFAAVTEMLLSAGVKVFGNGHSPYTPSVQGTASRLGAGSVALAAGVVAVATLVIAQRVMSEADDG
jgi:hypothetical protein